MGTTVYQADSSFSGQDRKHPVSSNLIAVADLWTQTHLYTVDRDNF